MRGRFASLHVRTICHATEDSAKVERALRCLTGDADIGRVEAEGHYGNRIEVLEVMLERSDEIEEVMSRLPRECLEDILDQLQMRLDNSCNLFIRLDKQKAYEGHLCLSHDDDVIAMRLKVQAFPAKREIASKVIEEFVRERKG